MSLAHDLIDHRVALLRHDAWLRREVLKKLDPALESALQLLLQVKNVGLLKRRKLLKAMDKAITEAYSEVSANSQQAIRELFSAEIPMIASVYASAGVKLAMPKFTEFPDSFTINGASLDEWWEKQAVDTAFKFKRIIREGLNNHDVNADIASELRKQIDISRREAQTLVRTAVAAASSEANIALRDNNRDILVAEKHLSTLDSRTSGVCRARDGLMWDLEQQPIGHDIPYKRPPLHPNCRSVMLLVTKYSEEWGKSTRASADSEVDSKTTYEDWLKGKSEQEQDKILGKGKAQMWREGKITLRDMLDQTGRELSLKELVALHGNSAANHAKQILKQAEKHEPQITQVLQQASK